MNRLTQKLRSSTLNLALYYLNRDPEKNIPKIIDRILPFTHRDNIRNQLVMGKAIMQDVNNPYRGLILRVLQGIAPKVRRRFVSNFVFNSAILGQNKALALKQKYNCNIPWVILMDPTSACNLQCKGCWAAEYDKTDSMDYALLDRIIREGKELGVYFYIYSGGEPTIRKNDLLKLAKVHKDCVFMAFTNGTLVDEAFAKALVDVGNFGLAFSIEGFEDATDFRRGEGTYQKVIQGMQNMKKYGAPFGFSACYHSRNTEVLGNEAFLDFLIEQGCMFGWYFTYIPLGKDADTTLLATPEQREYMFHWVRKMRDTKPIYILDFWNDGQYVNGCVAGGRSYLHINAAGDVEPCAFIHYSNTNIRNSSLLDALRSPIFREYAARQPFNENHLRPCPLLDNPGVLAEMVKASGAYSTQPIDREDVDQLTAKCIPAATRWAPVSEKLWAREQQNKVKV
ncbi:MAG TPA: radical SAM protein [Spirochaetales bacterium]|nr:radical SAM protein [Spirochaetales bacterium]